MTQRHEENRKVQKRFSKRSIGKKANTAVDFHREEEGKQLKVVKEEDVKMIQGNKNEGEVKKRDNEEGKRENIGKKKESGSSSGSKGSATGSGKTGSSSSGSSSSSSGSGSSIFFSIFEIFRYR